MYSLLSPSNFSDYELIDSGNFEKLERFGKYIISRPEPQAIWDKSLPQSEWNKKADALFAREIKQAHKDSEKGNWQFKKELKNWSVNYPIGQKKISFLLRPTSFKHVGIFPEQASNWDFIAKYSKDKAKVLNLFAYIMYDAF